MFLKNSHSSLNTDNFHAWIYNCTCGVKIYYVEFYKNSINMLHSKIVYKQYSNYDLLYPKRSPFKQKKNHIWWNVLTHGDMEPRTLKQKCLHLRILYLLSSIQCTNTRTFLAFSFQIVCSFSVSFNSYA